MSIIKQFILDVKIAEGTDINKLTRAIIKEIESNGHEVLTPNELRKGSNKSK